MDIMVGNGHGDQSSKPYRSQPATYKTNKKRKSKQPPFPRSDVSLMPSANCYLGTGCQGTKLLQIGRLLKILNSAGLIKDSPQLMEKIGSNKKKKTSSK